MAYVKKTELNPEEYKLKRTSSLNSYFICHYCDRKFQTRVNIHEHIATCVSDRTCRWCEIVFKNRGNLVTHAYYMHGDESLKTKHVPSNTCDVCEKSFSNNGGLKYHIRRVHFNLIANIPSYDNTEINEKWFEKVLNSDSMVEIKKTGHNMLLIRKLNDNEEVRPEESKVLLDLTSLYPTGNRVKTKTCDVCSKIILERDYKKHYNEKHGDMKVHHCDTCNMTFKRLYFFVRHTCWKTKRRGSKVPCKISKIQNLNPISV